MKLSNSYTQSICLIAELILPSSIIPLSSCGTSNVAVVSDDTLRWASTGGGWRAQFACVGFANLFAQKDLDILSKFSAISTTSGASWFSTQLFYSQQFYNSVAMAEDSQALYDFVVLWMESYANMLEGAIKDGKEMTAELAQEVCNVTGLEGRDSIQIFSDLCNTLVYFKGDWTLFVDEMLDSAAKAYGDADFVTKIAGKDNRLEPLKGTDLLIQAALAPASRIRTKDGSVDDVASYLSPSGSSNIYTVPISVAYVVNSSGTAYRYATESWGSDFPLNARTSTTSSEYSVEEWEDFYLYPAKNGTDLIKPSEKQAGGITAGNFNSNAFGGGDSTVVQVAAISSAAVGSLSPLAPSLFSQDMSEDRYNIEKDGTVPRLNAFDSKVKNMYNQKILDKFAVCSQWPNECGPLDGIFVDGWFSDNPAFVINVGHYHISGGDLGKTLKVILTNTNEAWPSDFQYTQMLQYFESPINKGVEPGGFNWPPGMPVPYQSPQIFSEFMDESTLDGLLEPIAGSNMTTAVLKGTTVDNSIFGIRAGQKVEILLINLNDPIITYIATPDLVRYYVEPLASMAKDIADNEELASMIKAFVGPAMPDGDQDGTDSSSSGYSVLQRGQFSTAAVALSSLFFFMKYSVLF